MHETFAFLYLMDRHFLVFTRLFIFWMISSGFVFASLAHRAPYSTAFRSASELLLPFTLLLVLFSEALACPRILTHDVSWASLGLQDFCRSEADLRVAAYDLIGTTGHPHFPCCIMVSGLVLRVLLFTHSRHKLVIERLIFVLHLCFTLVSYAFNYFLVGSKFS